MAVISLKLPDALAAQLTEQAQRLRVSKSELVRRALMAFLQTPEPLERSTDSSAADLRGDLMGCREGQPAARSSNLSHHSGFGDDRLWRCRRTPPAVISILTGILANR